MSYMHMILIERSGRKRIRSDRFRSAIAKGRHNEKNGPTVMYN